jgi:hypothetical protein
MATVSPSLENNKIDLYTKVPEQYDEGQVGISRTIYPGMLVYLLGLDGDRKIYMPQAALYRHYEVNFALANPYHGKTIQDAFDEYEFFPMKSALRGDVFLTKINSTPGGTIDIGALLCADTDGWLRGWDSTVEATEPMPCAVSIEIDPSPTFPRWTAVRII